MGHDGSDGDEKMTGEQAKQRETAVRGRQWLHYSSQTLNLNQLDMLGLPGLQQLKLQSLAVNSQHVDKA